MIKVGDKIPNVSFRIKKTKISTINTIEYFKDKNVVIFGLPGAFTPTCSAKHLPSYVSNYQSIIDKNIDKIGCMAVNDPHVMAAWGKYNNIENIDMISDSDCSFTFSLGLNHDYGPILGIRSFRFSMLVKDLIIKNLFVEEVGKFEVSSAENLLRYL